MSESEYSESSGEEEEAPSGRNLRNSSARGRQKPQKQPTRRASRKASYAPESSDDDDEMLPAKRKRVPQRTTRDKDEGERDAGSAFGNGDNDDPCVSSDYTAKPSPAKVVPSPKEKKKEASHKAESHFDSSEEEQLPKSPRKVFFSDQATGTSSEKRDVEMNGAARTMAKKGKQIPEEELIPTLVHCLKTNTAMMGDLAAELRLLRETLAQQNRKT